MVAGGRAIEQKEAAVGVPDVGRHRFRDAKGFAAEVGVSDTPTEGDVAAEGALAERVAQLGVGADAQLVSRRREGDDALPLVGENAFEKSVRAGGRSWVVPVVPVAVAITSATEHVLLSAISLVERAAGALDTSSPPARISASP